MKSSYSVWSIVTTSVVLFTAVEAMGQIDHRVNRGNTATGGRALDKNPGISSGGFNLTRPGLNDPGAFSNAVITGNITGLGGFKDTSPVSQSNQFRDSLPSASLSGFQARSVGLPEVSTGRTIAPTFYFGTAETVPNAGQIGQGLIAPGRAQLVTPNTQPPMVQGNDPSSRELTSLIRQPEDRRVNIVSVAPPPTGVIQQTMLPSTTNGTAGAADSLYGSAMSSSIFGTPLPPPSSIPLSPTGRLLSGGVNPPWSTLVTSPENTESADLGGVNPRLGQEAERKPLQPETGEPPTDGAKAGQAQPPVGLPSNLQNPPTGPIPTPGNLGADRFADLYNAVELAQRFGARNMGFNIGPSSVNNEQSAAPDQTKAVQELIRKPSEGLNQLATAAKWAKDVVDDPLRSFAGKYQDRLNQYMAAGEADLRAGRYYTAARQFDLAETVDPLNPLPLLAIGHAYVAAGDYVSAVHSLEEGIRRFPQIAAFRIDLPALVGQHDIFDIRRADLESKLANAENVELRFLLGYIELYSGLPEEGLKNLDRAAKQAPPASMIAIFADLVSGRRELPAVGK